MGLQEMAASPKLSPLMVLVLVHQVTKTCKGVAALAAFQKLTPLVALRHWR